MVFSSLIFLFLFLVLNLTIYLFVKDKYKNIVLLVFSLIFYAWGGPKYLLLLVGETFASWFFALRIEKTENDRGRKLYMAGECVVLLGLLGYFKYAVFFLENFQMLFGVPEVIPNIVLPIGISFYTFQLLSYVVDVYRGEIHAQPAGERYTPSRRSGSCFCIPVCFISALQDLLSAMKRSQMRLITGKSRRQISMSGCGDSVSVLPRRQFWQIPALKSRIL